MLIQYKNCVDYFSRVILDELKSFCVVWVAGGCVRDYFSIGYLSSDIDLYFPSQIDFDNCKKYLLEQTQVEIKREEEGKTIIEFRQKPLAKKVFENDNVLKVKYKGREFDIIKKFFPSPNDTISEFDFTVSCGAVDIHNVYTHETYFIDLAKRQLMINKLPFPLSTMWRMQKYIKKGYTMCSGEMLKLSKAIGELQTNTQQGEQQAVDLNPLSEGGPRFTTFD